MVIRLWIEIHIHHKKPLGSPQINVLEKNSTSWIVLSYSKVILSIWPSVNHVRKIFIPLPNLYLHFPFSNYLSKQILCLWEFSLTDAISLSKSLFINISPFSSQHFNCPCSWNMSYSSTHKLISFYLFWTHTHTHKKKAIKGWLLILKVFWNLNEVFYGNINDNLWIHIHSLRMCFFFVT